MASVQKPEKINVIPVVDVMPADLLTPLAVYLKLADKDGDSFLLESVEGGETLARYSFIGIDPQFSVTGNESFYVRREGGQNTKVNSSVLAFLREHFDRYAIENDDELPGFTGGAIGTMNFSCSAWFEPKLKESLQPSDDEAAFMFCRTIIAFDHAKQLIKIVTLVFSDEAQGEPERLDQMFEAAKIANGRIREKLENVPLVLPRPNTKLASPSVSANFTQADFEKAVEAVKEHIAAGNAYQVVLSQCFTRPTSASPVSIYRAMRSLNPSPYMFLINIDGRSVIGASPEMLVKSRSGKLEYRPIAGTRPRGKNAEEDARLAGEMAADRKEVAEHLMLVDLGRNDLGRVAEYGSVEVNGLMNVEKYSHVQHLVSYLSAELRQGLDRFDALASCFPAGTVSGAPKVAAIEIISGLEPTPRGIYSGAVGYFDYAGNMDTCIAIRTLRLENGIARVQAGAGIVADSVPELEYQETVNKAKALLRAIEIVEEGGL